MSIVSSPASRIKLRIVLAAGLIFLYSPIALVVLFSFNDSTSTTIWSGFSLRWYIDLLHSVNVLHAAGKE